MPIRIQQRSPDSSKTYGQWRDVVNIPWFVRECIIESPAMGRALDGRCWFRWGRAIREDMSKPIS